MKVRKFILYLLSIFFIYICAPTRNVTHGNTLFDDKTWGTTEINSLSSFFGLLDKNYSLFFLLYFPCISNVLVTWHLINTAQWMPFNHKKMCKQWNESKNAVCKNSFTSLSLFIQIRNVHYPSPYHKEIVIDDGKNTVQSIHIIK